MTGFKCCGLWGCDIELPVSLNQTWQTEWKTALVAKVQLCEYENQF